MIIGNLVEYMVSKLLSAVNYENKISVIFLSFIQIFLTNFMTPSPVQFP